MRSACILSFNPSLPNKQDTFKACLVDVRLCNTILCIRVIRAITFDLWSTLVVATNYSTPRIDYVWRVISGYGYLIGYETVEFTYSYSLDKFHSVWQNGCRYMPIVCRPTKSKNVFTLR